MFDVTILWQDIVLLLFFVAFVCHYSYKNGYRDGTAREKFLQRQDELEKSGEFFWSHGVRVGFPSSPSLHTQYSSRKPKPPAGRVTSESETIPPPPPSPESRKLNH